jgi:hypothetical protein
VQFEACSQLSYCSSKAHALHSIDESYPVVTNDVSSQLHTLGTVLGTTGFLGHTIGS